MTDVSVSLTEKKAERTAAILAALHANASLKASDRKVLGELGKELTSKIASAQAANAAREDELRIQEYITNQADEFRLTLKHVKGRGLTRQSVDYVSSMSTLFDKFVQARDRASRKNNGKPLSFDRFKAVMDPIATQAREARARFLKNHKDVELVANSAVPHADKRTRLAHSCLASGLRLGTLAGQEDDPDMMSMYAHDMKTHINLGVAILEGNARAIRAAANMDTSPRESLSNAVWDFVTSDLSALNQPARAPGRR